jgi:hypothetical protein
LLEKPWLSSKFETHSWAKLTLKKWYVKCVGKTILCSLWVKRFFFFWFYRLTWSVEPGRLIWRHSICLFMEPYGHSLPLPRCLEVAYFESRILVNNTYIYIYIKKRIRTDEKLYNCNYCLAICTNKKLYNCNHCLAKSWFRWDLTNAQM